MIKNTFFGNLYETAEEVFTAIDNGLRGAIAFAPNALKEALKITGTKASDVDGNERVFSYPISATGQLDKPGCWNIGVSGRRYARLS